uniref:MFS domain-containing protein n=1 Tax=Rhabditophanes sp. KR3021 TaxID=114890 RepID=A0AC35U891_9BILA
MKELSESIVFVDSTEAVPKKMLMEDIFRGRYTILICFFLQCFTIIQLANMFFMSFAGLSVTIISCGNTTFPLEMSQKDICNILPDLQAKSPCLLNYKSDFKSVNSEWGYVCGQTFEIKTSMAIQMAFVIIGTVAGGQISDSYGRRKITLIGVLLCSAFCLVSSFSNNLIQFTITRSLTGLFNGIITCVTLVFLMENTNKKHRLIIPNVISWSINTPIFVLIAYLCQDWRTLAQCISFAAIPAAILVAYVSESPKWLLQKGRIGEVKEAIKKIYRINNRPLCLKELDEFIDTEYARIRIDSKKENKKHSYHHLFYTWKYIGYNFTLGFTLWIASMLVYGIMFSMEKLSGSIYWNLAIMGIFRYIVSLMVAAADFKLKWLGRKVILIFFLFTITVILGTIGGLYAFGLAVEFATTIRILQLALMVFTSQLYIVSAIFSSEIFTTSLRTLAFSLQQTNSRIGCLLAPYLFYLSAFGECAPYFLMLGCSITAMAGLFFLLPETKGKPANEVMPSNDERLRIFKKQSIIKGDEVEKMIQEKL